jgi:hypothetical protein
MEVWNAYVHAVRNTGYYCNVLFPIAVKTHVRDHEDICEGDYSMKVID